MEHIIRAQSGFELATSKLKLVYDLRKGIYRYTDDVRDELMTLAHFVDKVNIVDRTR